MPNSIAAHFDGRAIVPDEPLDLPTGQRLRVQIEAEAASSKPGAFADLLELAADLPDAPADLAAQHDHYLYGTP